mmetsp:Transcript_13458/g.38459  ORF Transcript_13458/g.38459 Transcript_13458/m.38459 type:complete len:474 (+) Transcript_13458:91-1512(+)
MSDVRLHFLDVLRRTDEARPPLVDPRRFEIQQVPPPVRRHPPRGADDARHRTGLVQQLQIAVRMTAGIAGIHEHPAVHEGAVDVAYHGTDVAQRVRPAGLVVPRLEGPDVGPEVGVPPLRVGLVAAVHRPAAGDADAGMRQYELVGLRIEREAVDVAAGQREYQYGGRRVQAVAGPDQIPSGLQHGPGQRVGILVLLEHEALTLDGILLPVLEILLYFLPALEVLEQPEHGARADGGVGVARSVEGVEDADVPALDGTGQQDAGLVLAEGLGLLVGLGLLGGHQLELAGEAEGVPQHVGRQLVEALHGVEAEVGGLLRSRSRLGGRRRRRWRRGSQLVDARPIDQVRYRLARHLHREEGQVHPAQLRALLDHVLEEAGEGHPPSRRRRGANRRGHGDVALGVGLDAAIDITTVRHRTGRPVADPPDHRGLHRRRRLVFVSSGRRVRRDGLHATGRPGHRAAAMMAREDRRRGW